MLLLCLLSVFTAAQQLPPATPDDSTREISSRDVTTRFKVSVNLVTIRAVVRDAKGQALGNLKREDFQIFDNGKPQSITSFAVEGSQLSSAPQTPAERATAPRSASEPVSSFAVPDRYIAYVIDDLHAEFNELVQIKQAIERSFLSLKGADRVGIFTTSGRGPLDFTDDRVRLQLALDRVQPPPNLKDNTAGQCPYLTYYMADLIINKEDRQALGVVAADLNQCLNLMNDMRLAQSLARTEAMKEFQKGNAETRMSLDVLRGLVNRMSVLPGRRVMVLASPGFLVPDHHLDEIEVMDRAIRSDVVINTIDSRGLYVAASMKAESPGLIRRLPSNQPIPERALEDYAKQSQLIQTDVLESLADATGGTFIHNTNDFEAGIHRLAATPEFVYVLAFAPQNLKRDGKYHTLKVTTSIPKTTVIARRGYHAPAEITDPEVALHQELEDTFFSQQEINEIPFDMHSEFFKGGDGKAQLSLIARVQIRDLLFRKEADRSCDQLNVISGVFDRNGTFVEGQQKIIDLRLRDQTLDRLRSGVTVKSSFQVAPGHYIVRVVVRDTEGKQLSAKSTVVEIP